MAYCHVRKPGAWLWSPRSKLQLEEAVGQGQIGMDWEVWFEGDPGITTVGTHFRAQAERPVRARQASLTIPRYHTFWCRVGAGFIDSLIFLPLLVVGAILFPTDRSPGAVVWHVLAGSLPWIYTTTLHTLFGQTVGKKATGVKVMNVAEERLPKLGQALLRDVNNIVFATLSAANLIYSSMMVEPGQRESFAVMIYDILSWCGMIWFLAEIITLASNRKRRALHDYIARTVVIRLR